jgi:hypothetical protein
MPKKGKTGAVVVQGGSSLLITRQETFIAIGNAVGESSTNLIMTINALVNERLTIELANVTRAISEKYDIDYEELNELASGFISSDHLGPLLGGDTPKKCVTEEVKSEPKRVVKRKRVVKAAEEPKGERKRRVKKKPEPEPEQEEDEPEVKTCSYMIRNSEGVRKKCTTEIEDESEYCAKHFAIIKRVKKRVPQKKPEPEPEPEPEEEDEPEPEEEDEPEADNPTVVILRKNKWGNREHYPTHFVFNEENKAIGKQTNTGKVLPLTGADMRICQTNDWDYIEPGDSD